jgi:hypothetical protein
MGCSCSSSQAKPEHEPDPPETIYDRRMRTGGTAIAVVGLMAGLLVGAAPASAASRAALHPGERLRVGDELTSPNGRYHASVRPGGRLVVQTAAGHQLWATASGGRGAALLLTRSGQLLLTSGTDAWRSRTRGSHADRLALRDDGALTLTARGLTVWTSRVGSDCPAARGKAVLVDIGDQRARMCRSGQQMRTTPVTTGASALGYGTPTGSWRVYARARNTTLYPAAGGAYPVNYWMPYSGPYGFHDSPWQHFRYGSPRYTTRGSHGCVHVPGPMMAWLFDWARVGTRVTIHG